MPPKKVEEEPKFILGRPKNSLSIGLLGLPNVGKSSIFNLMTKLSVAAENYPFCTIDPNDANVKVPDDRYEWLCNFFKPKSEVPAMLTITDIAGLIKGASKGEGLGNAFLSHVGQVDGMFHVVRVFEDEEVTHVEGAIDPIRDLEIINEELILKDISHLEKEIDKVEKVFNRNKKDKVAEAQLITMKKALENLKEKKQIRWCDWKLQDVETLNSLQLLTAKPVVYLLNMSETDFIKKKEQMAP